MSGHTHNTVKMRAPFGSNSAAISWTHSMPDCCRSVLRSRSLVKCEELQPRVLHQYVCSRQILATALHNTDFSDPPGQP